MADTLKGFTVTITSKDGKTEIDDSWETVSGGELELLASEATPSAAVARIRKSVSELFLQGPPSISRKAFLTWLDEAGSGKDSRRDVTITLLRPDGSAARITVYHDCFITHYTFPELDSSSHDALQERTGFKASHITFGGGST